MSFVQFVVNTLPQNAHLKYKSCDKDCKFFFRGSKKYQLYYEINIENASNLNASYQFHL